MRKSLVILFSFISFIGFGQTLQDSVKVQPLSQFPEITLVSGDGTVVPVQFIRNDSSLWGRVTKDDLKSFVLSNLGDFGDVLITSPADSSILIYNQASSAWLDVPYPDLVANQTIDTFRLNGASLELSISGDGESVKIVNLADLPINPNFDYIQLDTSYNNTDFAAGEMGWDETDGFRFGVLDNYSFMVGQDVYKQVHNTSADTIYKGQAVMFTGADGASTVFRVARMDYPANPPEIMIGIAAIDILPSEFGVAVQNGYVKKIDVDAQGWLAGDKLYLSETTPGQLTTTPGGVLVAAVMKTGSNGTIYTRPDFYAGLSKAETDAVGAMVTGNTETLIDVTYQADSTIDFVVNDDLSLYDNSTSAFLTTEVDGSVTNEIQDLSLSGNTLSLTGDPTTVDLSSVASIWTLDGTNIYSDISNSLDSATYSFAAGFNAGSIRDMDFQNALGGFAGQNNTGSYQNSLGYLAGRNNTGARQNAFGRSAGENNTGNQQNAFGTTAGQYNTGNDQNAFGTEAGQNNTGANQNAFGFLAGQNNSGGFQNAFAYLAGRNNTGGNQNAFGRSAGESNTGFSQNAFGSSAGKSNSGTSQNAFGYSAGENNTGANQNAFGFLAGQNNYGGNQNAFGLEAGRYNQGDNNISIGYQAGHSVDVNTTPLGVAAGDNNTWLNYRAGYSITEGDDNIGIGYNALYDLTTGDNNIALGRDAGNGLTTQTNTIAFGRSAIPGASGEIRIGNSTYYSNTVFPQKITAQSVANDNTVAKIAGLNASDEIVYLDESDFNLQRITDNGATTTNNLTIGSATLTPSATGIILQPNGEIKQYLQTAEGNQRWNYGPDAWQGYISHHYRAGTSLSSPSAVGSGFTLSERSYWGYNSGNSAQVKAIQELITSTGAFTTTGQTPAKYQLKVNNGTSLITAFELNTDGEAYFPNISDGSGFDQAIVRNSATGEIGYKESYEINTVEIDNTSTSVATSLNNYSELHLAVAATTTSIVVTLPNPSANMVGKKIKIFNFLASSNDVDYAISSGNFFSAGVLTNTYTATTDGRIDELTCIPDPQSGGYVWAVEQN